MSQPQDYLRSARHIASQVFACVIRPGDRVVDATLGTGQDCLQLARLVGQAGLVYGFDVQQEALDRSRALLLANQLEERAQLFLLGHERMAEVAQPGIRLAAFNLGWLPGSDKQRTTRVETTLQALQAALSLLAPRGIITVCIYPGHPEGAKEQAAILDWASKLPACSATVLWHQFVNGGPGVPSCLVIEKLTSGKV